VTRSVIERRVTATPMHFRRFSLADGANLPGDARFRACLSGIRARLAFGRPIVPISDFALRIS